MKVLTVARLYSLLAVVLLVGWFINLYHALTRSPVDWRDAAAWPLLGLICFTLLMLSRVRNRLSADPTRSVRIGTWRYIAAGLLVGGLFAAFILGFHEQR